MICVSIQKNLTSRGAMHNEFYKNLRGDFFAKYIQSATSIAKARLKLYRTTKNKLWRALPRQIQYPSFNVILEYLRVKQGPTEFVFVYVIDGFQN